MTPTTTMTETVTISDTTIITDTTTTTEAEFFNVPSFMKAIEWTTPSFGLERDLTLNSQAPLPKNANSLPEGWTLVRVAYSSLNAVDYKVPELPIVGGRLPTRTPCMDFSGTVVSTNRADLKPGQKVFGKTEPPYFGALAEYVVVNREGCVPVPEGVRLEDAATIGVCGLVAYQCTVLKCKPGDKILINGGSGGVGTYAIQMAKLHGLHVTTTCSKSNLDLCRSLGADEVIDYQAVDLPRHLASQGHQYDLVLDLIFSDPALYWQCPHFLKENAPFITIVGFLSLSWLRTMLAINLLPAMLGGGRRNFEFVFCNANADNYKKIAAWLAAGSVKPVIERTLELDEVAGGFARLKSARTRGKITVRVGGG